MVVGKGYIHLIWTDVFSFDICTIGWQMYLMKPDV